MPAPTLNMYWKSIPQGAKVEIRGKPGTHYYVVLGADGKEFVAYWEGREAGTAQSVLDRLAGVPAKKGRRHGR